MSATNEEGGNPVLWNPEVVRRASIWAMVLGGALVAGELIGAYGSRASYFTTIEKISIALSALIGFTSVVLGFRLFRPTKKSKIDLTILIVLYAVYLVWKVILFFLVATGVDTGGVSGFLGFIVPAIALYAFINGRREMVDFPG